MSDTVSQTKIQSSVATDHSINVATRESTSGNGPHLLFCGGFHSNMNGNKANFLATVSEKNGWGFTRFDYQGHGESDGDAEHCSLHDWLEDTLAVIDSIPHQLTLIGSSMGAWLAVHATLQRPDKIEALVTIAAAPDFTEKLLLPALTHDQKFSIEMGQSVTLPGGYDDAEWHVRDCLFKSGRELSLLNDTTPLDIHIPIRMLHGNADTDVPWVLSQQLLDRFSQSSNASLTLISGGDHRLSDQAALYQLENAISQLVNGEYSL